MNLLQIVEFKVPERAKKFTAFLNKTKMELMIVDDADTEISRGRVQRIVTEKSRTTRGIHLQLGNTARPV